MTQGDQDAGNQREKGFAGSAISRKPRIGSALKWLGLGDALRPVIPFSKSVDSEERGPSKQKGNERRRGITRVRESILKVFGASRHTHIGDVFSTGEERRRNAWVSSGLEALQDTFKETLNPLYAWEAWNYARENSCPAPEWVSIYIDKIANSLLDGVEVKDQAQKARDALGLQTEAGRGTNFSEYRQLTRDLDIIFEVDKELRKGIKKGQAYADVAGEYGLTADSVGKIYLKKESH